MSPKHSPTRLSTYLRVHNQRMEHLLRGGFLQSDDRLFIVPGDGCFFILGDLPCDGGIDIDVDKRIVFIDEDADDPLVQTVEYRYNVTLRGVGVVFRYDSPHQGHNQDNHVHRYDVLSGDRDGKVDFLFHEDEVPTLGEVVDEAADWYYSNIEAVQALTEES